MYLTITTGALYVIFAPVIADTIPLSYAVELVVVVVVSNIEGVPPTSIFAIPEN